MKLNDHIFNALFIESKIIQSLVILFYFVCWVCI